jgi:peptide/nickel transport system permease protein
MSAVTATLHNEVEKSIGGHRRIGMVGRILRKPTGVAAVIWLALVIGASLLASWIAPHGPLAQDLLSMKQMPSAAHLLGTDAFGRDVLSRLLHGGAPTLAGVLQAVWVASFMGIALGVCAGYFQGWTDRIISQIINLMMSLPTIVILLTILTYFNRDMFVAMTTAGVLGSASIARVVRSATLNVRQELYVAAAQITGLRDRAIILRHIVPRILGPITVQMSLFASISLLIQTGISFLGLGIQPPAPTWGGMIFEASVSLTDFPWLLVPSGMTVALTILAFGLLGDAARDAASEGWSAMKTGKRVRRATTAGRSTASHSDFESGAVLSARGISIATGAGDEEKTLVKSISFDLLPGETLGIVGESGSGKTLTSLSLMGLLPHGTHATSGRFALGDEVCALDDARSLARLRGKKIGMIFQEPMAALDPCFSVGHQLIEVLRWHFNMTRKQAEERMLDLLRQVQILDPEDVARRYPHQISGGMAQRVGIAKALAPEPGILLADEPTTALDVTVQAEILDLIRSASQERGMAVILVSHDWGVVADICDRAMVLYKGDMLEIGRVEDIFERPQHPYTKALLRADPHGAEAGVRLPTIQETLGLPNGEVS